MNLQIISDVHGDTDFLGACKFLEKLDPSGVDILILAGDILPLRYYNSCIYLLKIVCNKYSQVVFVMGNHEVYNYSIKSGKKTLGMLSLLFSNFIVLDVDVTHPIGGGKKILGGTLWFPDDPLNPSYFDAMPDFTIIEDIIPTCYEENSKLVKFLEKNINPGDVVVTHHLPSSHLVDDRYRGSNLNRFFVADLTELILEKKPGLWCCGHSHIAKDITIGSTRCILNPVGYNHEQGKNGFLEKLVIIV